MSQAIKLKRILVANRGEIACRILKTAKELGYETVAVYSEADAKAPHVAMADVAVCIGAAPVSESYLCIEKVIAAAVEVEADTIHPGYGFLSENAGFAKACADANIVFVGPSAEAIDLMGNKAAAKRHMLDASVPCVPGYQGEDQCDDVFVRAANGIGFPIMVKAAAGGGGRGLRLVEDASGLVQAIKVARSEAENAFGSSELILEKAILSPRHVEIQVFADNAGNVVHMGERDCSVQRRHQKVIEEAPCPIMTESLRAEMGSAAVSAAKSIGYVGAGTVEFLLDASGSFYFLEMNTRLQVEHPVTEMVTGHDLVALQFSVAEGRPLGFAQKDIKLIGHAMEVRLYAEDPENDFLPETGMIAHWQASTTVRTDSGITSGQVVSPFYDPMLVKMVSHGATREEARLKLVKAIKDTALFGLKTNASFLLDCLENEVFVDGSATTHFVADQMSDSIGIKSNPTSFEIAIASVLDYFCAAQVARRQSLGVAKQLSNWASASTLVTPLKYQFNDYEASVFIRPRGLEIYDVEVNSEHFTVETLDVIKNSALIEVNGQKISVIYHFAGAAELWMAIEGRSFLYHNQIQAPVGGGHEQAEGSVFAPMHGLVLEVRAEVGGVVEAGDCLATLEAMKMQHQITATMSGTIKEVMIKQGQQISADQLMFEIEEEGEVA